VIILTGAKPKYRAKHDVPVNNIKIFTSNLTKKTHSIFITNNNRLEFYMEIIAVTVCCDNHTKPNDIL